MTTTPAPAVPLAAPARRAPRGRLSGLTWAAASLALAGLVVHVTITHSETVNGVCRWRSYRDYGPMFFGATAIAAAVASLPLLRRYRWIVPAVLVAAGAVALGAFEILKGLGVVGLPACKPAQPISPLVP